MRKLHNGLLKISDTQEKVKVMSIEMEEAKKQVAELKTQCDKYNSNIVEETTEADCQEQVSTIHMFTCT